MHLLVLYERKQLSGVTDLFWLGACRRSVYFCWTFQRTNLHCRGALHFPVENCWRFSKASPPRYREVRGQGHVFSAIAFGQQSAANGSGACVRNSKKLVIAQHRRLDCGRFVFSFR